MTERLSYAGIGSRETPDDVLDLMHSIGYYLSDTHDLRTGGANGADEAFFLGAQEGGGALASVYLPWPTFNEWDPNDPEDQCAVARWEPQREAFTIAKKHHPAWDKLSRGGRCLHARNVHQVLGYDVTVPAPAGIVLCWTPGGQGGGGTGQAIRIANAYGVTVVDLAVPALRARIEQHLAEPRP